MDFTKNIIVDVYTAYYYTPTGELVYTSKNLTKGNLENKSSSTNVTNGRGDGLWTILNSNKEVNVTLTENTFNFDTLSMLSGSSISVGAGESYSEEVDLVAGATKDITLPVAPIAGAVLTMFCKGVEVTGTLSGTTVTFTTGVAQGDTVRVYPYKVATEATSQTIVINNSLFPSGGTLVLKTQEVSADKKVVADIDIVMPNAIVTSDFKLDTTSKVQANESDISMKICAYNDNGDLYKIVKKPRA